MSAAYITCEVLPGLFNTEYYVLLRESSYYVHRDNVKVPREPQAGVSVAGQVFGYIIEREQGRTLVQLPGEAVVGGLRTWVEDSALTAA